MTDFVERTAYYTQAPVALVVGCGGLGYLTAKSLGRRHPLLIVDIDGKKLDETVESLRLEGYTVAGYKCDITNPTQTKALGKTLTNGPGVRVLAHIAAVGMSIGDWRKMMKVDLFGVHHVAQAVGPSMVPGGAAIFISSLASYLPPIDAKLEALLDDPLNPAFFDELVALLGGEPNFDDTYNYAKLGVNRLAEKLALEWGEREVRALSLSPGMIDSPMARNEGATLPSHDGTEKRVTRGDKAKEIPLRRQGTMLEIVNVIDFLASDSASFLNGIDIAVDGGHRAAWRARGITKR